MQITRMESFRGTKGRQLLGLTGIRGVGAVWVLALHAQFGLNLPIANRGYLGVDLFFMLSGFVLSLAHGDERWTPATYRRFVQNRVARIFPLHLIVLAALAVSALAFPAFWSAFRDRFSLSGLISSALLVQNWGIGQTAPWNYPAWSLSTEWLVSIAFPVFCWAARRVDRTFTAVMLCGGCLLAFTIFLQATGNSDPNVLARAGIIRTACEFMAGCVLFRFYKAGQQIGTAAFYLSMTALAVGVIVPSMATLAIFGFPALILRSAERGSSMERVLSSWPAAFLGRVSFSIYLIHWPMLQVSDRWEQALGVHGGAAVVWFFAYVAVVFTVSTLTYRWIEIPGQRWFRKKTGANKTTAILARS